MHVFATFVYRGVKILKRIHIKHGIVPVLQHFSASIRVGPLSYKTNRTFLRNDNAGFIKIDASDEMYSSATAKCGLAPRIK